MAIGINLTDSGGARKLTTSRITYVETDICITLARRYISTGGQQTSQRPDGRRRRLLIGTLTSCGPVSRGVGVCPQACP